MGEWPAPMNAPGLCGYQVTRMRSSRSATLTGLAAIVMGVAGCSSAPLPRLAPPPPRSSVPPDRVVEIAAGAAHTCALRAGGTVDCWGSNEHGQLGLEGSATAWTPARVPGVDDAVHLAAGWGLTCARRREGTVRCWGSVRPGRRHAPGEVAGIAGATEIAVGRDRVCAVLADGGVACKAMDDAAPAARIAGIAGAKQLAAGAAHTCALLADRTVRCWGRNDQGQLGDGTQDPVTGVARVVDIDDAVRLGAALGGTCAFRANGDVDCWGELGMGRPTPEPWSLPWVDGMVGAAASISRACGLFADGSVQCVRESALPELRKVAGISDAVQVVAGFMHFCALGREGRVRCWGDGSEGHLGVAAAGSDVPRRVPGLDDARDLAIGDVPCAVRADGGVTCWGRSFRQRELPTAPRAVPGMSDAVRLATNGDGMCVLGKAGAVRCWGERLAWMGAPSEGDAVTALDALGASAGARSLAVGDGVACVVDADGRVRCAGRDDRGERAGSTDKSKKANVVPGLEPAVEVASVDGLVCARLVSGKVACWGAVAMEPGPSDEMESVSEGEEVGFAYGIPWMRNVRRKVRPVVQRTPRLLPGIEGGSWLGRVHDRLCAVRGDDTLCWSRDTALATKPIAGLVGAVALSGRCAVLGDGRVACFDSSADKAPVEPTIVPGLTDVVQVATRFSFACARKRDGSVWCWGSNERGWFGDGGDWGWREAPVEPALP